MSAARRQGSGKRSRARPDVASGQAGDRQRPWSTQGSRVERIDRVLVEELEQRVEVRGAEAHHLRDVLRVRPGSTIEAFDGHGRIARGEVEAVSQEAVVLALGAPERSTAEPELELTLAVALLKGDKLSDVVRPATELGVSRFELFVSTNCEARELSSVRLTRLRRVAREAARQSGRALVPTVAVPVPLVDLLLEGRVLIGDPAAETSFAEYLPGRNPEASTIVTGPEGGLTDAEVELLRQRGAVGLRLGPRILRADTAPVAMAAALLLGATA